MDALCICGSTKHSNKCCERFLSGKAHAKTPEQLLRSRYCAYALGGYGQYLMDTWLPATSTALSVQQLSSRQHQWQKLTVLKKCQQGDNAVIEFKAFFIDHSGRDHCLHETSRFCRQHGRWYYVRGEIH